MPLLASPSSPARLPLRLGSIAFGFVLLLATASAAEPAAAALTPEQAAALLRNAQKALAPGSYRQESTRTVKNSTTTSVTLMLRRQGMPTFSRTETVTTVEGKPERTRTRLSIVNAEGRWQVFGDKAVLQPNPIKPADVVESLKKSAPPPEKQSPAVTEPEPEAHGPGVGFALQMKEMAKHIRLTGERYKEGEAERVRITRTFDEEGQKTLRKVMSEQIGNMTSQLSFGKRILVKGVLAAKGGVGAMMPVREVFILDPTGPTLLSTERFNEDGKSIGKAGPPTPPEKIDDLPLETFDLPAGVEAIRPKTFGEAIEIMEDLAAAERKKSLKD